MYLFLYYLNADKDVFIVASIVYLLALEAAITIRGRSPWVDLLRVFHSVSAE